MGLQDVHCGALNVRSARMHDVERRAAWNGGDAQLERRAALYGGDAGMVRATRELGDKFATRELGGGRLVDALEDADAHGDDARWNFRLHVSWIKRAMRDLYMRMCLKRSKCLANLPISVSDV